jgi:hypothetical protein
MDRRHSIGNHPLPSVIHALLRVGKTTTFVVVVFCWYRHKHHSGDVLYDP